MRKVNVEDAIGMVLCHDITQIGAIVDRDIDYNPVNDLLKKEHIKSIDYLKSNL